MAIDRQNIIAFHRAMVYSPWYILYCNKPEEFGVPDFQTPCRSMSEFPNHSHGAFLKSTSLGLATIKSHVRIPVVLDLRPLLCSCLSHFLSMIKYIIYVLNVVWILFRKRGVLDLNVADQDRTW